MEAYPIVKLTFSWNQRLHEREDFQRVLRQGKRWKHPKLVLWVHPQKELKSFCRLGLVTPRTYGNAVHRNRFKRLVRETFRLHQHDLQSGHDLIVRPQEKTRVESYWEMQNILVGLWKKAGLVASENLQAK